MSLSVERLKELMNKKIEHMGAYDLARMKDAIRELIAIKEAEPVAYAWVGYLDRSYTEFPAIQEQEPNTVPLIRKPE